MGSNRNIEELRRVLFQRQSEGVFYATIRSVDESKRSCEVEAEEMMYEDVSLYAIEDDSAKGFCFIPTAGSMVLVGRIGGSNELYVAMFSEVDKVLITIGDNTEIVIDDSGMVMNAEDTTLSVKDSGLSLTRGGNGLKKTLDALIDAILQLTVSTSVGPSSPPINAADFTAIKNELTSYLE